MIDPARRIAKWNAKYDTERIKSTLDAIRSDMYVQVQAVVPLLAAMELQVTQTLDAIGTSVAQYASYLAFAREIWSLLRQDRSGESAVLEAQVLVDKWVARGLTLSTLEAIRSQVFNISAPVGP